MASNGTEQDTRTCGRDHIVTSVWSAYGHRFESVGRVEDDPMAGYVRCLTCGAEYVERAECDGPDEDEDGTGGTAHYTRGAYVSSDGSDPVECTGNGWESHALERTCSGHTGPNHDPVFGSVDILPPCDDEDCPNVAHGCACVLCSG